MIKNDHDGKDQNRPETRMDTGFQHIFPKSRALMIYLRVHEASFGGGAPPPALRPWTTGPAALPTGCACRFAGLRLDKVPRLPTASTPPTLNEKAFNSNPLQNTAGGPRHEVRGGAAPGGRGAVAPPLGVQFGPLWGPFDGCCRVSGRTILRSKV